MVVEDTIAAIATPPGAGGVAVLRISGPGVAALADALIGGLPPPRYASFRRFLDASGATLDEGLALYFPRPHSFSGEDVLELQGHGGVVVSDLLLRRVLQCGARLAQPGEFSKRAFLNGKLDLTQAEALADLIEAGSGEAARLAVRSLEGVFSQRVHELQNGLTQLRMYVEASIDFPEEEIDFLSDGKVLAQSQALLESLQHTLASAHTGRLMRDGIHLVIAGPPNAGKSSLLNALAGWEAAIVSAIPGTTRDLLRERIQIDGIPIHLVDTAGLRHSEDPVEQEGVRRARHELHKADLILWLMDERDYREQGLPAELAQMPPHIPLTLVRNKMDLAPQPWPDAPGPPQLRISAKQGTGLEELRQHIKHSVSGSSGGAGEFLARRRHLDALERAEGHLRQGMEQLQTYASGELLAEELRLTQQALSDITGECSADDLLGEIFAGFCIGK